MPFDPQIFLSHAGEDSFEADLLQYAFETLLKDLKVATWGYRRDQKRREASVAQSIRHRIGESVATVFLLSRNTLRDGMTQWMELAYADAFEVPVFVLLHRLNYDDLRRTDKGVPPLVLASQCTPAIDWRSLESELRNLCVSDDGNLLGRESRQTVRPK